MAQSRSEYPADSGFVVGVVSMAVDSDGVAHPAGAPVFNAPGTSISYTASAVQGSIPPTSTGAHPIACRFASTTACYVKLTSPDDVTAVVAAEGAGYLPDDTVTLAGGTFSEAAVLNVETVDLLTASVDAPGTGVAVGTTLTTVEGDTPAVLTASHIKLVSATINAGGTGGTPGAVTLTGTTGTGTKFQIAGTISAGGVLTAVGAITVAGNYTVNPVDIAAEPVTGGSLVGATLTIVMGALTVTVTTPGVFSSAGPALTATAHGVTFTTASYGILTVSTVSGGDYTVTPSSPVAQGSTSGAGTAATFTVTWAADATPGDMLIQPGDATTVSTENFDQVSAIRVTASGVLVISPLEN